MNEAIQKAPNPWAQEFKIDVFNGKSLLMKAADVKRLLNVEKASVAEAVLFLRKCQQYGADPFMNDMHMVKYKEDQPASIITGVGFFQKKAAANPKFKGYGPTKWLTDYNGESSPEWVDHWIPKLHGKYPLACRATCYIEGYEEPQTFTVNWEENVKMAPNWVNGKRQGEKVNSTWDKMPSRMLEKDAIVGLLRQVLPQDLGGLYISEEITGEEPPQNNVAPAASMRQIQDVEPVDLTNTKKAMEHVPAGVVTTTLETTREEEPEPIDSDFEEPENWNDYKVASPENYEESKIADQAIDPSFKAMGNVTERDPITINPEEIPF